MCNCIPIQTPFKYTNTQISTDISHTHNTNRKRKLRRILYGSKPVAHTFFEGLAAYQNSNGYKCLDFYPFISENPLPTAASSPLLPQTTFSYLQPPTILSRNYWQFPNKNIQSETSENQQNTSAGKYRKQTPETSTYRNRTLSPKDFRNPESSMPTKNTPLPKNKIFGPTPASPPPNANIKEHFWDHDW